MGDGKSKPLLCLSSCKKRGHRPLSIEKPEHTFKYTLNLKWNDYSLIHKGTYISSYYSDSDNTIEIHGRYVDDIWLERSWKIWLVYLETINFLDKKYEKYYGRPGNERVFRLGVQWDF